MVAALIIIQVIKSLCVFLSQGKFSLQDPVYVPGKINQYYQNAYLYLQPYYTTTKSYVKIQPLKGVLACEQKQEVWVDYSIDDSDLGENTQVEGVMFSYYVSTVGRRDNGDGACQR